MQKLRSDLGLPGSWQSKVVAAGRGHVLPQQNFQTAMNVIYESYSLLKRVNSDAPCTPSESKLSSTVSHVIP